MPNVHEDLVRPDKCFDRFCGQVLELDFDEPVDFAYAAGELGILSHYVLIRAVQISQSGGVIYGSPPEGVLKDVFDKLLELLSGGALPKVLVRLVLDRIKKYVAEEVANPVILDKAAAYLSTYLKKAA